MENQTGPFLKKNLCALYLSHTNFVTYVPVLGAEQFQFPCGIIFDEFLAEDEHKPKL